MLALAASFFLLFIACQSKSGGPDVMASVDGRKIMRGDVDKYYQNQTAGSEQQPVGEQATSLRLSILRELIDDEILMRRAEKLGLLATDEEVERKLNEIKSPYTADQFDQKLKEKKITLDDFKHDLRRSLTVEKVLNKEITSKINVTDQDITDYYNAHKSEFNLIETQYHLAQIFVTPMPNPQVHNLKNDKAQTEADARKKIQMLSNRLDSGDDFATLAMNYSEDAETSANGGDLGFTPESALQRTDPSTREVVMKLKPGQYSPVIPVVFDVACAAALAAAIGRVSRNETAISRRSMRHTPHILVCRRARPACDAAGQPTGAEIKQRSRKRKLSFFNVSRQRTLPMRWLNQPGPPAAGVPLPVTSA